MGGVGRLAEMATGPTTTNCWNLSRMLARKPEGGPLRVVPRAGGCEL